MAASGPIHLLLHQQQEAWEAGCGFLGHSSHTHCRPGAKADANCRCSGKVVSVPTSPFVSHCILLKLSLEYMFISHSWAFVLGCLSVDQRLWEAEPEAPNLLEGWHRGGNPGWWIDWMVAFMKISFLPFSWPGLFLLGLFPALEKEAGLIRL